MLTVLVCAGKCCWKEFVKMKLLRAHSLVGHVHQSYAALDATPLPPFPSCHACSDEWVHR